MKYTLKETIAKRILLKLKDKGAYYDWKFAKKLPPDISVPKLREERPRPVFKHSGNSGDIIYALPAMYAAAGGKKIQLALSLEGRAKYDQPHPLGDRMLTAETVAMLQPLLEAQEPIQSCAVYANQEIDLDFDLFRKLPIDAHRGDLAHWYFWTFGVSGDLSKPWLKAESNPEFGDSIVIARSQRYNQPAIDYGFLKKYKNLVFVGVREEFDIMRAKLPDLQYAAVENFYQLASVIAGSKLFIGNQSFPFALAEGLKAKRLLEVYHRCPNVMPCGNNGAGFCFQPHFEKLTADFLNP